VALKSPSAWLDKEGIAAIIYADILSHISNKEPDDSENVQCCSFTRITVHVLRRITLGIVTRQFLQ
jgi:hypothetical protein